MANNEDDGEQKVEKYAKEYLAFRAHDASSLALRDERAERRKRAASTFAQCDRMQPAETEAQHQDFAGKVQQVKHHILKQHSNGEGDYFHLAI